MSTHDWSAMAAPVVKITKLRSRRCQRCRWRKIKCDENWPTCTPCVKARCPCSGPPASLDGSDSDCGLAPGSVMPSRAGSPAPSLISSAEGDYTSHYMENQDTSQLLSHYEYPGGSSYTRVRLASAPRSYPTTTADRVASRLVGYLEPNSRFHASLAADYFRFLPARIGSSAALRDAVALFCTGWGNFRRATPPRAPLVDPRAYGKALRSLQRALSGDDNEGKQLAVETLAAASVMDRVEVLFGGGENRYQCVTHAQGVYSLMATRGPPLLDDELDVCLAFTNQTSITSYLLSQGSDNFYVSQRWRDAMNQAVTNGPTEFSGALIDFFYLSLEVGGWPALKAQVQHVTHSISDPIEQTAEASLLWEKLDGYRSTIDGLREGVVAEARRLGQLTEKPSPECPNGVEFIFTELEPLVRMAMFLTLAIIINRLQAVIGGAIYFASPETIEAEHRHLCELMWSCVPQIQRQGPGAILIFTMPLSFCLEAGNVAERTRVVETLMKMGSAAGQLPHDLGKLERVMLDSVSLWTGKEVTPMLLCEDDVAPEMVQ